MDRERGLVTLEWLIVFAAAAALAAASAAALQRMIDSAADTPSSRGVRAWEADTAAARVERDARNALQADPSQYHDAPFRDRCNSISRLFVDTVSDARWIADGPAELPRCDVTLR